MSKARRRLGFTVAAIVVLVLGSLFLAFNRESNVLERSVAVLPFENLSPGSDDDYLSDGVHADILTQLSKISSVKVISRTSVLEYRDSPKNMRQIGEELGVATILEGSVQRAADNIRINVQLIDADTDEHLWAETYDRGLTAQNVFAIQSEMATAIAEALEATLLPEEVARLNELPTTNTPAYLFYVTGDDYFRREDFDLAIQQYKSALDEDLDFALAWAGLARAHASLYFWRNDRTEERRDLARNAIERAEALAPNQAATYLALGYYRYYVFNDFDGALAAWDLAEEGMPGEAELYEARGYVYRRKGGVELVALSAENLERAVGLDPLRDDILRTLAFVYETQRDYTRADQALDRILAFAPHHGEGRHVVSRLFRGDPLSMDEVLAMQGTEWLGRHAWGWHIALYDRDYDAALEVLDAGGSEGLNPTWGYRPSDTYYAMTYELAGREDLAVPHLHLARDHILEEMDDSPDNPRLMIALGEVLARLGEAEPAIDLARRAMQLPPASVDAVVRSRFRLNAIGVLVAADDHASAIDELEVYLSEPGEWSIEGLMRDPRLDPILEEPRFQALVGDTDGSE